MSYIFASLAGAAIASIILMGWYVVRLTRTTNRILQDQAQRITFLWRELHNLDERVSENRREALSRVEALENGQSRPLEPIVPVPLVNRVLTGPYWSGQDQEPPTIWHRLQILANDLGDPGVK